MRYIKKFENSISFEYEVGDYVWLEDEDWGYRCVKVLDLCSNSEREWEQPLEDYYVETINPEFGLDNIWVNEEDILRKAKPEEIEQFELYLSMNKYNL